MRVYKSQSLKEDPRLHNRLTEILSTSWTNPKKTLDDELVRASHLACIFEKERVMAFISWERKYFRRDSYIALTMRLHF